MFCVSLLIKFIRNVAVIVLGQFWFSRSDGIRIARNKKLHTILGHVNVWVVQRYQYYRYISAVDF